MPTAYINIGSNMGDRLALIEQAVTHIEHLCGAAARRAPVFVSKPWGYDSEAEYLNMGIAIDTDVAPTRLFRALQSIEQLISSVPHRDANGNYADREIDIDIIAIDETVLDSENLILPHPRMHLRDFVLVPMHHLAPEWRHPLLHATPGELLERRRQVYQQSGE